MTLNYNIKSPKERCEFVEQYLQDNPDSPISLEKLADYIIFAMDKKEKHAHDILTENRMITVNRRETSLEGITDAYEANKDDIYNHFTDDKDVIFRPSVSITPKDIQTVPGLAQLKDAINLLEEKQQFATNYEKYKIKQMLIELRKDQYVLKDSYLRPIVFNRLSHSSKPPVILPEHAVIDGSDRLQPRLKIEGFSLLDPSFVSLCLCNYSQLKQSCDGDFQSDTWYMMEDLDNLCEKALKNEPRLKLILILKIDGKQNSYIREELQLTFGLAYTQEYISSLWRHKIPNLIAKQARLDYLEWYYTIVEKGQWKTCTRCGCTRLATPDFFSRNRASKDGLYSICKECRSVKNQKEDVDVKCDN